MTASMPEWRNYEPGHIILPAASCSVHWSVCWVQQQSSGYIMQQAVMLPFILPGKAPPCTPDHLPHHRASRRQIPC